MDPKHATSDLQSLELTRAAVHRLQQSPWLVDEVLATLDRWDRVAPAASGPLRERWRSILLARDWMRALDPGEQGQALRQASPLGKALDAGERLAIIRECKGRNSST